MYGGSGSGSDIYRERDPATRETRPDQTGPDGAERRQRKREAGDKKDVVGGRKTVLDDGFCNLLTSS
ncbi:hypothetical protein TNCT_731281 [Trichonephila clavata]|uniref:Uncharacterized protein n=1 Tax=Trichonephila clavata TaxID=2740835 RepID=A0A8X6FFZ0_TRICU|nr:hypothetical protein TNCT_731281 [Trichonephila clavata]